MVKKLIGMALCQFVMGIALLGAEESLNTSPKEAGPATRLPMANPAEVGMSAEKLDLIQPAVEALIDAEKIPGAVVVVARHGKIAYFRAMGWKDIEAEEPLQKDTIFRFYSMTKPVTSVAVMMLIEEGKLGLDDLVEEHIPELASLKVHGLEEDKTARPMTVRDLLRHTSGLTYGFFGDTEVDKQYRKAGILLPTLTLEENVRRLGKLPLLYAPGTKFNYSVSTDVLGRLVEIKSRQSLDNFFAQRIFEPLGMVDTAFFVPETKIERFIHNYGPGEDGLNMIDKAMTSSYAKSPKLLSGGGGLVSTAVDYIRFCQMLLNKGELQGKLLLKSETVAQMTTNQLPDEAYPIELNGARNGVGFGLGFSVIVEPSDFDSDAHVGEYGWGGAASTHFWISPNDDLAVVAITQHMPFTFALENAVKPLVYDAIADNE